MCNVLVVGNGRGFHSWVVGTMGPLGGAPIFDTLGFGFGAVLGSWAPLGRDFGVVHGPSVSDAWSLGGSDLGMSCAEVFEYTLVNLGRE